MLAAGLDVTTLAGRETGAETELTAFFAACPTSFAQQTPWWRDVITAVDRDEPRFLLCRRRRGGELLGVLPAYRFEGPRGAILTSVPQAGPLGGVACREGAWRPAVYRALLEAYLELARSSGCACASLISNPFWPDARLYAEVRAPDFQLQNTCQALDLASALDAEGWPVRASRNLRRNLKSASAGALVIDETQSPENVEGWYAIHAARHREIGATPLPEALFRAALESMVPADKARFFFVRLAASGEMVAGGFYLYHGSVIDALMPSLRSSHAHLHPNVLLGIHSMRWARRRGLRWYNWQPSPPEGGVRRFKLQWGSAEFDYAYLTWATGDMRAILAATPAEIRSDYPWHYVVPFDRLGPGAHGRGESTRSAAWRALERAP